MLKPKTIKISNDRLLKIMHKSLTYETAFDILLDLVIKNYVVTSKNSPVNTNIIKNQLKESIMNDATNQIDNAIETKIQAKTCKSF